MNNTLMHLGLIEGMPAADYFAIEAMSSSGLRRFKRSPWHYRAPFVLPQEEVSKPSPQMIAGTLGHACLLEPERFERDYVIGPDTTKTSKVWKEFVAAHPGCEVITLAQHEVASKQAISMRAHPEISKLLKRGKPEVSCFWRDAQYNLPCKARLDWVHDLGDEGALILDYKTTSDAGFESFSRSVANFGYHLQARWYMDGYEAATGREVVGYVLGVVESDFPYCVAMYMLDQSALDQAAREIQRVMARYAQCVESDRWPGYPVEPQLITLPSWATVL